MSEPEPEGTLGRILQRVKAEWTAPLQAEVDRLSAELLSTELELGLTQGNAEVLSRLLAEVTAERDRMRPVYDAAGDWWDAPSWDRRNRAERVIAAVDAARAAAPEDHR